MATHTLCKGTILYSSWGYDQTNIDFWEVVRATPTMVELRQLQQETVEDGFMQGHTRPLLGQYRRPWPASGEDVTEETTIKRKVHVGEPDTVRLESFAWARRWDGQPKWCSWYA